MCTLIPTNSILRIARMTRYASKFTVKYVSVSFEQMKSPLPWNPFITNLVLYQRWIVLVLTVLLRATFSKSWWRHQMEPFSALLAICAGNSPVPGEFLAQWPVTRSFDVFFGLRLNKRLSKQSRGWWFETLSRPLWRHRNVIHYRWEGDRVHTQKCLQRCHTFCHILH